MNIRGLANAAIQSVNPNITVTVRKSDGFTLGAGRKQVPQYLPPVAVDAQLQALDGDALKHMDSLNIQGTIRNLRLFGPLLAVARPTEKGGDLIDITNAPGFPGATTWLVVKVLEMWPDWTSCAIVLQQPGA
jgi:hypothetical protein